MQHDKIGVSVARVAPAGGAGFRDEVRHAAHNQMVGEKIAICADNGA